MKKILDNIYLFSKLATSLTLFILLMIMGYFFYISYQGQNGILLDNDTKENNFKIGIQNNTNQIKKITTSLNDNKKLILKIDKLLKNNDLNNDNFFHKEKLKVFLDGIEKNINALSAEIKTINFRIEQYDNINNILKNNTSYIDDKPIKDLVSIILIKYESNLDFEDELNSLEKIVPTNKIFLLEKIRINAIKVDNTKKYAP